MTIPGQIKPTDKAIKAYYTTLQGYSDEDVTHEGATETAFQKLLADTAKSHGWFLIPKLAIKRGGKQIIPDGTLRDEFRLPRGYWEAKDTQDKLEKEISKKAKQNYPLSNTIFKDTREAVLFQNGAETLCVDLTNPQALADLLNAFYSYAAPDIESFEKAVGEFKERVPELAMSLVEKIKEAHKENQKFQAAFDDFFELCRTALNPNLSPAAIDEMLVQHLLTERLIRKMFDHPEFSQRNVIAIEVEKVIAALVSHSFSRDKFLKSLDRFYRAIENAARELEAFSEKQHFLNTVYERFFQGYSVKTADTHGIVYTPQEIVDFMCASVVEILKSEFDRELGDEDVQILDPCTGTGNFIVNLMRRIPKKHLVRVYREQLFANEIMLLPCYIASLNIELAYLELTGEHQAFEGLCFVDTLDMSEKRADMFAMTEQNTARVARQKKAPITVIIGNPPYNAGQVDENDNNKNRKYDSVDRRIRETYSKDSAATLNTKLYDPYVKFFRWAMDRLNGRDGIVCLVTNNSFVHKNSFDGMRKHLLQDFTHVYHLDLRGDVKLDPQLSGTAYNVFGIQVGVGVTIAVRMQQRRAPRLSFHQLDKLMRRHEKLSWMASHKSIVGIKWKRLTPDERHSWLVPKHAVEYAGFLPLGDKEIKGNTDQDSNVVFQLFSLGLATNRDEWAYDFSRDALTAKMQRMITNYNYEVFRASQEETPPEDYDAFVNNDPKFIKWTDRLKTALSDGQAIRFVEKKIRHSLYRPFTRHWVYFDHLLNQRRYQQHHIFPNLMPANENQVMIIGGYGRKAFAILMANSIPDLNFYADPAQCFPFYAYDENGSNRRDNITNLALTQFRKRYNDKKIAKWDIFHYVYGLLHHRGYSEKFADNLKRELPRIPLAPDFKPFAKAGRQLAKLHLEYEQSEEHQLDWIETPGEPLSYRVERMKLTKDKTAVVVNPSLTLGGIPPEALEYRLGNRSALEWVIDQYQVSEDKRSGIRSDPNRPDDPEYIVRLIGQVVHVSIETVRIVNSLPDFV